jgi:hypothetical protein
MLRISLDTGGGVGDYVRFTFLNVAVGVVAQAGVIPGNAVAGALGVDDG